MNPLESENIFAAQAVSWMDQSGTLESQEADRTLFFQSYQALLSRGNTTYSKIINLSVLLDAYCALSNGELPKRYFQRKETENAGDTEFLKACDNRAQLGKSLADVASGYLDEIRRGERPANSVSARVRQSMTFLQFPEEDGISLDLLEDLQKEREAVDHFILYNMKAWIDSNLSAAEVRSKLCLHYQQNFWVPGIQEGISALLAVINKLHLKLNQWDMTAQPATEYHVQFQKLPISDLLPDHFPVAATTINLKQLFTLIASNGLENSCLFEAFSNALFRSNVRSTELRVRAIVLLLSQPREFCAIWSCRRDGLRYQERQVIVDAMYAARRFNDVSFHFVHPLSRIASCDVFCWKQEATETGFHFVQDLTFTALTIGPQLRPPVQLVRYNIDNSNGPKNHVVCMVPISGSQVPTEYWSSWESTLDPQQLVFVGTSNLPAFSVNRPSQSDSGARNLTQQCASQNFTCTERLSGTSETQVEAKDLTQSTQECVTSWPDEVCYALGKILEGVKPFSADDDLTRFVGRKEALRETREWLLDVDDSWHPAVKQAMCEVAADIDTVLAKLDQLPTMQSLPTTISLEKLIE